MVPGTEIHIAGHGSVLNDCNAVVIDDAGSEVYFVTLVKEEDNPEAGRVGGGARASLSHQFIRDGLKPPSKDEIRRKVRRDQKTGIPSRWVKEYPDELLPATG